MLLNHLEIKAKKIIQKQRIENYGNASYDLCIGKIISSDGVIHDDRFVLKPQHIAIAVSFEELDMKVDVLGFATIKTSLSQRGLMAINIGLIDPDYEGPISSVLLNFGKQDFILKPHQQFLRLTFQKFKSLGDKDFTKRFKKTKSYDQYVDARAEEALNKLDTTFSGIDSVLDKKVEIKTKDIKETIWGSFTSISWAVATFAILVTFANWILNPIKENPIKKENELQQNQIDNNKDEIKKLELELTRLNEELKK